MIDLPYGFAICSARSSGQNKCTNESSRAPLEIREGVRQAGSGQPADPGKIVPGQLAAGLPNKKPSPSSAPAQQQG